ncbi:beta strand repeat-containing protein [Allocoleopsis franciscana]|uniref:beta strand repeat-containing protein n=1 Tax=Allocoleopsis franciscana TaxID=2886352 RepID=UPI0009005111|nr:S-layer family protein [Allocoleopsis franciscana]
MTSAIILSSLCLNYPLQAQIVPDNTLLFNSLTTQSGNTSIITGGTPAGSNLFHSFSQFSVPTGGTAYFNNSSAIQNIFSRVTGSSISNIDGLIRANDANLFLLNPNGIIFGPNASLDIGGSFLGTTANRIIFADNTQFSTTNPQTPSLLMVNVPVGLGFGSNQAAIRVQGTGQRLIEDPLFPLLDRSSIVTGLRVSPGKTLALVGGDVTLDGALLTAEGGRIELGSVGSGIVSLSPTTQGWALGYQNVQSFQNIQLLSQALVDASEATTGNGGGSIHLQGANVALTDGSFILIQSQGDQPGGSINVNASESLEISGSSPDGLLPSRLVNQTVGAGQGGDIELSTQRLIIRDGGYVDNRTLGSGNGGEVRVNATESVQVSGASAFNPSLLSFLNSETYGSGRAGDLSVSTGQLRVLDGGAIVSATFSTGSTGTVRLNATQSIEVAGAQTSRLVASTVGSASGNEGNAESVIINTRKLVVRDGGRVDSSTLAYGNAGSIIVNASESVEVSGKAPGFVNPSLIISSANIVDPLTQAFFGLPPVPTGDSGNVTINTPHLSVTDGAQVTVRNDGTGKAGTLIINADSILLDNQGGITASTNAGESAQEGSITLNVRDSLQMRHNSIISAEARGDQRGGNIIINAGAIAAVPEENSDITASAPQGTGGRITINTQGIFGTQVRDQQTPESDIIAVGKTPEFNGIVQVNTPEINVQDALNQLNTNFFSTEQAIASSCFARRNVEQGSFTSTGTGGLPTTPYDAQGGRYPVTQVQALPHPATPQTSSPAPKTPSTWKLGDPIQEAQGISVTPDGRILVGTHPQLAALKDPQRLICHPTQVEE